MQTKTGDLLVCQLFSKISEGAGDTRRADTTGGTTSAKDGSVWTEWIAQNLDLEKSQVFFRKSKQITLHKVWPIYWFKKWLQEFPWHFLMTFRTLLEDLKKSKLLAETKLLAQRCKAARLLVTKFQEGPPFPLAFWRIFCSHFLPTASGWRFMVGCLGSFARKWGGCDVCPGWRGGQMFLGPSSPLKNWRQVKRWAPPKPVGFLYPRFKNLPFWFGEGSFHSITWCKRWYIHVYNFYI